MPDIVEIRNLRRHDKQEVTLRGWLYGKRTGGKIAFLLVRDGTGVCQCVVEAKQERFFQGGAGRRPGIVPGPFGNRPARRTRPGRLRVGRHRPARSCSRSRIILSPARPTASTS